MNILVVLKLQGNYAAFSVEEVKSYFDTIGHEYRPTQIGIDKETYKKALRHIKEYVKSENLEKGLWFLNDPFQCSSIDEIIDWVFKI